VASGAAGAAEDIKGEPEEETEEQTLEQEELGPLLVLAPAQAVAVQQGVAALAALQDEVEGVAALLEQLAPLAPVVAPEAAAAAVLEPAVDESVVVVAERRATRSSKPQLLGPLPAVTRRKNKKN